MEDSTNTSRSILPSLTFLYHELCLHAGRYTYAVALKEFEAQLDLFTGLTQPASRVQAAVSFDDGHLSDYELAWPALTQRGMAAHFFITVGWAGQPGYMDWPQLRSLHQAGQRIGAHGWTHTLLTHCTPQQLDKELIDVRRALEDRLGAAVTSMSLPGGRYNRRVLAACHEAGYTDVFTSIPRAEPAPHGFLVGRVNMRAGLGTAWIEQLLQPGSRALASLGRQYHAKTAARALLGDTLYARVWTLLNRHNPESEPGLITAR